MLFNLSTACDFGANFCIFDTAIKISRGNYLLWPVEMTGLTKKICVTGKSVVGIRMN